jgi:hypothetical protein
MAAKKKKKDFLEKVEPDPGNYWCKLFINISSMPMILNPF